MINRIDADKCTGCGTCQKTCALDVFRIQTGRDNRSPCMAACPAGTDIRGCHALMQMGQLAEAAALIRASNPFAAVTGRVCPHPCEGECARARVDEAVNINALEQYLGDLDAAQAPETPPVRHVARVAVAGSGPAGLSCAWFLAVRGYPVTVFEALSEPGGMLRWGIPAYRLPTAVVEGQIARLKALGVRFECNVRVGAGGDVGLADLRERGFKAVCLAPGAAKSRRAGVPGEDRPGVFHGVEFLRAARSDAAGRLRGAAVVVGGGDVAMDTALTALRLGAERVDLVCLESGDALPAFPHNVADARKAGVVFHPGWGPARIEGADRVRGLIVRRCLAVTDADGRFAPRFDETDTMTLAADSVLFAIGQSPDPAPFRDDLAVDVRGRLMVDPVTFATSVWDVFAAGDAVSGPASVIRAVTAGREAALSIHRLLSGGHQHSDREETRPLAEPLPGEGVPSVPRHERRDRAAAGFEEVRAGLDHLDAADEAMRCMTCGAKARIAYRDDCMTCFFCEMRCPTGAIDVHPFKERLPHTLESNFGGF